MSKRIISLNKVAYSKGSDHKILKDSKNNGMEILYSLNSLKATSEELYNEEKILNFVIHHSNFQHSFRVSLLDKNGTPDSTGD